MISQQKRFCEYGLKLGVLQPGAQCSITDVPGIRVGHTTRNEGSSIRTGVTIIDPGVENIYTNKIPGAIACGNGFGKLTGGFQVEELGTIETPIALTNTLAVGTVMRGVVDHIIASTSDIGPFDTINAIVGETNDGFLNDIHAATITPDDIKNAFNDLSDTCAVGCVGAGTGTRAFSWKGGIGTASRIVNIDGKDYVLGVLTQTNYGGSFTCLGAPIGSILKTSDLQKPFWKGGDGSCMTVIATNAPITARQLKRIARRTFLGLARTGSIMANGSGDFAIAFSTNRAGIEGTNNVESCLSDQSLSSLFLATVESTEESIYDAVFSATDVEGKNGNTLKAAPVDKILEILREYQDLRHRLSDRL